MTAENNLNFYNNINGCAHIFSLSNCMEAVLGFDAFSNRFARLADRIDFSLGNHLSSYERESSQHARRGRRSKIPRMRLIIIIANTSTSAARIHFQCAHDDDEFTVRIYYRRHTSRRVWRGDSQGTLRPLGTRTYVKCSVAHTRRRTLVEFVERGHRAEEW